MPEKRCSNSKIFRLNYILGLSVMNKYMRVLFTSSLLIIFLPSTVQAQNNVERLTRPIEVTASNGSVYSEIRIVCSGKKGTRYIVRGDGSSKWCVTLDGSQCKSNKLAIASKACSLDPSVAITQSIASSSAGTPKAASTEAAESTADPKPVVVSSSQAIEQERKMIEVEREKIKARRQELERRKTELESITF